MFALLLELHDPTHVDMASFLRHIETTALVFRDEEAFNRNS